MIGKYFRYFFIFIKITLIFFVGKLGITFYQENVKQKIMALKKSAIGDIGVGGLKAFFGGFLTFALHLIA